MRAHIKLILTTRILLSISVAALIVGLSASWRVAEASGYIRQNALEVKVAFWTNIIEPHYGAFFYSGRTPYDQHYSGSGGDSATLPYDGGISAWSWWGGPPASTLLLPKRWLGTQIVTGGDRMTPSKHNAMCYR
jgi:hypothetical protein